ncbi:hypothetical protein DE146DRAFT_646887 [Phaeosphaeria sp. MPI-PUGE-AT-0046c]|nr:hypothetical protein DE146DRAFT_646887 [Phaeosphaeria sp. MPI-PUGE-AT-0046c]
MLNLLAFKRLTKILNMSAVTGWMKRYPIHSGIHLLSGLVFIEPQIATRPFFYLVGAGEGGIGRDSFASSTMSWLGPVKAKSIFAHVQSAAMGGYGAASAATLVRTCAATTSLLLAYRAYRIGRRCRKVAL